MTAPNPTTGPVRIAPNQEKLADCSSCGVKFYIRVTGDKPAILSFCPFCGKWADDKEHG